MRSSGIVTFDRIFFGVNEFFIVETGFGSAFGRTPFRSLTKYNLGELIKDTTGLSG